MPNTSLTKIAIASASAPPAAGPYSQAVRIGEVVYTAGQLGSDPKTGAIVAGGIAAQTAQAIKNTAAVLGAAGTDLTQVVKTSVFLQDMKDFDAMNAVYATYFAPAGVVAPARSTVQVSALPKGGLIEIDVVAVMPEKA
jgi:2-iminobutanoate/2-iminopropanoate deaminase